MLFFISPTFPASAPIVSSTGNRINTGLWAFAWKFARDTSMCMIENVFLLFAATDIIAFNASSGGVLAYRSGRSSLSNSLAHIRDLICMGSPSNALSVSIHFVSTLVIPYFATACFSSTFSYTPRSRKYFKSSSRAWRTACHSSSFPVISSMHMTSCSWSCLHVCQHRVFSHDLRFARPFKIDLHKFSSLRRHISSSILQFSNFPTFPPFTPSTTMCFNFCSPSAPLNFRLLIHPSQCSSNFVAFQNFRILHFLVHPSRRSPPCRS